LALSPLNKTKGLIDFQIQPHFESSINIKVTAHVLNKLTASIPSRLIDPSSWVHLQNLQVADPRYFSPRAVDLILGADVYTQIIEKGIVKGPADCPIAQSTKLGWIISGPIASTSIVTNLQTYHVSVNEDLYYLMQKFWELEEVPSSENTSLSLEEQECENHFRNTHTRNKHGQYVVQLPFKLPPKMLGDSKSKAMRLINKLNHRFQKDKEYAQLYTRFIEEYEALGHMKAISLNQPEPTIKFYLPHHGVWKESSVTTKLRVVFNGSSKSDSGFSLNDLLYTGPKLQTELFDVLIWFRQFRHVFMSDIEKMYRQIAVHPDH